MEKKDATQTLGRMQRKLISICPERDIKAISNIKFIMMDRVCLILGTGGIDLAPSPPDI